MKKIIMLITCLLASSVAMANTPSSVMFADEYPISSNQPNRIVTFSPGDSSAGLWTYTVNKTRQIHNVGMQSDTLTVVCNGVITLIKAGQTASCKLQHGQVGSFFIADVDYINGNDGTSTYTDLTK